MKKISMITSITVKSLSKIIKIFPKPFLNFLWNQLDSSESKMAILFRYLYMKKYCKSVGEKVFIGKSTNIKAHRNLEIGSNVSIHSYTYIDAHGGIKIGDNVSIANHCTLIASDHTWSQSDIPIKYNPIQKKPIVLGSDIWIAAGVRILGNVSIKNRTVVGAGAVVNRPLEGNSLYVGVPAKLVKRIDFKEV